MVDVVESTVTKGDEFPALMGLHSRRGDTQ
jgi:hypothetical protein